MENNYKIAVFFDAENISAGKVPLVIDELETRGDILFQRAYADWSTSHTKSWQEQLEKTPIMAIQQFHHNEKQAVDKLVMMDAIEMAIKYDNINLFALVASDNGYYSLALRLRELGKRVIGFGEKQKCNSIWVKSCNEFVYLEDLDDKDDDILISENEAQDESIDHSNLKDFALEKFFEQAYDKTPSYKDTDTKLFSRFWESVYRQKSDFNIKDYGVRSPVELIKRFSNKFKITDDGKPQKTYFIEKIEQKNDAKSARKTGFVKRRIENYRILTADDGSGDYFFYMGEINPASKGDILEKGTKVTFSVTERPGESSKNGNGRATDVKVI